MKTEQVAFKKGTDDEIVAVLVSRCTGDGDDIPVFSCSRGFHTVSRDELPEDLANASPEEYDRTLRSLLGRLPGRKISIRRRIFLK